MSARTTIEFAGSGELRPAVSGVPARGAAPKALPGRLPRRKAGQAAKPMQFVPKEEPDNTGKKDDSPGNHEVFCNRRHCNIEIYFSRFDTRLLSGFEVSKSCQLDYIR